MQRQNLSYRARDIYYLLDKIKVKLELKEIAIGVRVEHDQSFINNKQYHNQYNKKHLPPQYCLIL